jgi:predicted TIM-barrel fold metal-dependent hydrolase
MSRLVAGTIDADGHVVEPAEVFDTYLDERYRAWAPRVLDFGDRFRYVCGDRLGFAIHNRPESVGAPETTMPDGGEVAMIRGGADPDARLADMDTDGIDVAVLYPTYGLMVQGVTERAPAVALCRAINDWLAHYCRRDPSRLLGAGTLPMTHPDDALAEAKRCVEELGFAAVWRRPERFEGIPALHDPGYGALWSYLEDVDVPLAIHPGMNGVVPCDYFRERFDDDYAAMHAAHFPVEQMMNLTSLVVFGVLERHPRLRVALLETGAAWVVPYLHRLDEHHEKFPFPVELSMPPSHYFRRQCFVSVEEPEPGLALVLDAFPESVVFASDYPHGDCTFPGATKALQESPALDDAARRAVLRDNAVRLYPSIATR